MAKPVRLRNTNPLGAVDLPLIGRVLQPGEEFEVAPEQAENLLSQVGNYERVTNTKSAAAPDTAREG